MAIAAIVGGTAVSAGVGYAASSNATNAASNAANQNNALQSQIYNTNKDLAQPYIDAGDNAETALNGFLGLGGDPAATQKAFQNYLNSTGYQFNLNQGLNAASQSKAAAGLLDSGSTLKALDAYGTGLADQYGQQYVGNLQNLAGTGQAAASGLAGAGQSYAGAVGANNTNAANASANAGYSAANTTTGLINGAIKSFGAVGGGTNALTGYPAAFNQPGYSSFDGSGALGSAPSVLPGG